MPGRKSKRESSDQEVRWDGQVAASNLKQEDTAVPEKLLESQVEVDLTVDVERAKSTGSPLTRVKKKQQKSTSGAAWGKLLSQCSWVFYQHHGLAVLIFRLLSFLIMESRSLSVIKVVKPSAQENDAVDSKIPKYQISLRIMNFVLMLFIMNQIFLVFIRRQAMRMSAMFCIVGWLAVYFSMGTVVLDVGRFLTGYGIGIFACVVPVLISEIAPKNLRDGLATLNQAKVRISTWLLCSSTWSCWEFSDSMA